MLGRRSFWRRLMSALHPHVPGEPSFLLPFDWVKQHVPIHGWKYWGLQEVELAKVAGSLNRYRDFDRAFLPLRGWTDRLRKLERAWRRGETFPPVQLYKLGEAYFVVDGHHRVAAARRQGGRYIDAEVFEFLTEVPVSPSDSTADILLKAEQVQFLRVTQLDKLRPGSAIQFTEIGGYRKLLEHIDVHRYFRGLEEQREIPYEEAVVSWYDRVYTPLVEAFRRTGILTAFPGRTPADLYVWVSEHLHYLRERWGPQVDLDRAARDFAARFGIRAPSGKG